jgi:hypothetical protein
MHHVITAALATLLFAGPAYAGKKAPAEPVAIEDFEIMTTEISQIDSVFEKAKAPIETLKTTRVQLDTATASLGEALGVTDDLTLDAALRVLQTEVDGAMTLDMKNGFKLSLPDDAPDEVKAKIEKVNTALVEFEAVKTAIVPLPEQFAALATEAGALPGQIGAMGLTPTKIPAANKGIKTNLKLVGLAKTEAAAIVTSLDDLKGSLEAGLASK